MVAVYNLIDFSFLQLKIMSAPNVFYFPPQEAGEHKDFVKYDLSRR